MKNIPLLFFLAVILGVSLSGCKTESPTPPVVDIWDKDTVLHTLFKTKWRVGNVYRVTGSDTVDLDEDPGVASLMLKERKNILLGFQSSAIVTWGASPTSGNPKFREGAETYFFTERAVRPTFITYEWDEELETIVARSNYENILNIPPNQTAILDKSSIVTYASYQEEEKSSRPSNLTFKVEASGATYLYKMKPVWYYESDLILQHFNHYVVFP